MVIYEKTVCENREQYFPAFVSATLVLKQAEPKSVLMCFLGGREGVTVEERADAPSR